MSVPGESSVGRVPPVRLETLLEDFVWLRIVQAPMLALAPSRWALALLAVLAVSVLRDSWGALTEQPSLAARVGEFGAAAREAGQALLTLAPEAALAHAAVAAGSVRDLLVRPPTPGAMLIALPELVIWLIVGLAIARMVALDFGRGELAGPTGGLRFGVSRLGGAFVALGAPALIAAGLGAIVAVGALLGAVPALDVIAAVLGAIGLVLSLLAALLVTFAIIGAPLMLAAMAADGADAADAIQRAWAYLLARPLRLAAGALAALGLGWALVAVVGWFVEIGVGGLEAWSSVWSTRAGAIVRGEAEGGTAGVAAWILGMWVGAARAAVLALGVSYFFTASTLLYLLARQSCDGQDYTDIWTAGETERLIEDALQARAAAGGPSEGATRLGARVSRPEPSETE